MSMCNPGRLTYSFFKRMGIWKFYLVFGDLYPAIHILQVCPLTRIHGSPRTSLESFEICTKEIFLYIIGLLLIQVFVQNLFCSTWLDCLILISDYKLEMRMCGSYGKNNFGREMGYISQIWFTLNFRRIESLYPKLHKRRVFLSRWFSTNH